jgi:DNA-binding CsgD family transcriptional regulator
MSATPLGIAETFCAAEAGRLFPSGKRAATGSAAGFVLVDARLNPISFNAEAVQILTYPTEANEIESLGLTELGSLLGSTICSILSAGTTVGQAEFVAEFTSGRRRYVCRTFYVNAGYANAGATASRETRMAVVLERAPSKVIPLAEIAQQFRLTQREVEVLGHLMQALTSREIANRMNVSPSTVKAFLRTMMIKMGVCSRSAAVGKALMSVPLRSGTGEKPASAAKETFQVGQAKPWASCLD